MLSHKHTTLGNNVQKKEIVGRGLKKKGQMSEHNKNL